MNSVKRLGLAAFLVVLGALFAASPALARKPAGGPTPVSYTFKLTPPEIDPPEPQASGQWTVETWSLPLPSIEVNVSCKRLTPAKPYHVVCLVMEYPNEGPSSGTWWWETHSVAADGRGRLNAQFTVETWGGIQFLWVENDEGDVVLE